MLPYNEMSELRGQRGEGWRREEEERGRGGMRIKDLDHGVECTERRGEEEEEVTSIRPHCSGDVLTRLKCDQQLGLAQTEPGATNATQHNNPTQRHRAE